MGRQGLIHKLSLPMAALAAPTCVSSSRVPLPPADTVSRYYYDNFTEARRQDALDLVTGAYPGGDVGRHLCVLAVEL